MSNITGTVRASLQAPTDPLIYNVSVPLADTEVSQALSPGVKTFLIRARGASRIKLAFLPGESGTTYITISAGTNFFQDLINFNGTLYFQTNKGSETVEILEWS